MPITFVHALAVRPVSALLARFTCLSALIVGSMMPDMGYFLPIEISRATSHAPDALLWFCVPIGLVSYFFFHRLMAPLIYSMSPKWVATRFPVALREGKIPTYNFMVLIPSILLGAITHIFWDAFTHQNDFMVVRIPILQTTLAEWKDMPVRLYNVLQHGSSLIGIPFVFMWIYSALEPRPRTALRHHFSWLTRGVIYVVLCIAPIFYGHSIFQAKMEQYELWQDQFKYGLRGFVVGAGQVFLMIMVVLSLVRAVFIRMKSDIKS